MNFKHKNWFYLRNYLQIIIKLKLNFSIFSEHLFNLKFAAKELDRNSRKCEKDEKVEKLKCKKAIQKGLNILITIGLIDIKIIELNVYSIR